jgi:2-keto-3-deoxy-L-rhamnonate aldolase RhmA
MSRLVATLGVAIGALGIGSRVSSAQTDPNPVLALLDAGQVVFGSMAADRSEAGGAAMAADPLLDFVFYDMERSYDLAGLQAFMRGFRAGVGAPKTLLVRIAPIANGRENAQARVAELLAAGADGIVFPRVRNREDAEFAVGLLRAGGRGVWPQDPAGKVVGYFMIEDQGGIDNARAILSTPGVGFGAPGQGSLRSALGGDATAVEAAIQGILSTCKELRVVCAKLVDDSDVERRVREGFRVIMGPASALETGRRAAGCPAATRRSNTSYATAQKVAGRAAGS